MDNTVAFKAELKALLKKYNAEIGFSLSDCSDTHGINGEKIVVSIDNGKDIDLVAGWGLGHYDL